MILNDRQIKQRVQDEEMIVHFISEQVRVIQTIVDDKEGIFMPSFFSKERKAISYGTGSFGYDPRLHLQSGLKIFSPIGVTEINPKRFNPDCLIDAPLLSDEDGWYWLMPPNTYALGVTVEYFKMPKDIVADVLGKSTLARCGLIINATPLEPGWEGNLVLELSNVSGLPLRVYPEEGIAQIRFHQGEECEVPYGEGRKYQGQTGIITARV